MSAPRPSALLLVSVIRLCAGARAAADDGTATVRGTVTVDGKPLDSGRIFFFIGDDQFVGAKVKDGQYMVDRVPVGRHTVTVEGKGVSDRYSSQDRSALTVAV